MLKVLWIIFVVSTVCLVNWVTGTYVSPQEWAEYKAKFKKDYTNSTITEAYARYYFAYNKRLISNHNMLYDRGSRTYKLAVNQFTDMRFKHFNELFPEAIATEPAADSPLPIMQPAPPSYDPITDLGFVLKVEDQGAKCNSGWAYSSAKAIELFQAQQAGNMRPLTLSAQNLIDCAGRAAACTRQVPQAAFDYLTKFNMDLHLESDYKNNNTLNEPDMCTPSGQLITNLATYSHLKDGDEESLKACVSNGFPVVVEFNPSSFEFMHYSEGIFQHIAKRRGSQHMLVTGYGTDKNNGLNYWLLQNSFGPTWGEMGFMRLLRNPTKIAFKNAILPTELA